VPPFHWAHHPDLEPLPHDPAAARALLDSVGWIDRDGDGARERDGERASFELKTHPSPSRQDVMTLVQADLAEIGVEARLRVQEAQSLARDVTGAERNFDAIVIGWAAGFNLDDRPQFSCGQLGGTYQWSSYCNPRVDELLDQLVRIEDRATALPLWYDYQEIVQAEQPYTFLYYEVRPNGVRRRIRGVEMDIRGSLINVAEWWIDPADRRGAPSPTS
jgi:peptide/nickel transport system substrate-binding protein